LFQNLLQHLVIAGEFPDETLQLGILPLQRPEALGLRNLPTPALAPPPLERLRRDLDALALTSTV
jgi:hypothetical protein